MFKRDNHQNHKYHSIVERLLKNLEGHKPRNQFGHVGCQEALHVLRSALTLRRQHGMGTYTIFIDLAKAFDTIDHPTMFQALEKYGVPQDCMNVVKKMYQNCVVRLQIQKKEVRDILYGNGVQQGDNMAPILFIYIMMAATNTLRHQLGKEKPEF